MRSDKVAEKTEAEMVESTTALDVMDLAEVEVLAESRGMNANERHLDWIPTEIELRDEDDNVNADGNNDENGTTLG